MLGDPYGLLVLPHRHAWMWVRVQGWVAFPSLELASESPVLLLQAFDLEARAGEVLDRPFLASAMNEVAEWRTLTRAVLAIMMCGWPPAGGAESSRHGFI